jgi:hypothetical protein
MRLKYFFLLFFINLCGFSQNLTVKDLVTQQPVPYVSVYFLVDGNTITGLSATDGGTFALPLQNFNQLKFSCIGYEDKVVEKSNLTNVVYLQPKATQLEEVLVGNTSKPAKLGYFEGKKGRLLGLLKDTEEIVYIRNTYKKPVVLQSFSMKVKKAIVTDVARLVIYKVQDTVKHTAPGETLLQEDIVFKIATGTEGVVTVDLSEYNILLPAEGAYIGVDIIECYDANGRYSRDIHHMNEFETIIKGDCFFLVNHKFPQPGWVNTNVQWERTGKRFSKKRDRKYFVLPLFWITVFPD